MALSSGQDDNNMKFNKLPLNYNEL